MNRAKISGSDFDSNSTRPLIDIYTNELEFLITLKQSIGILNNRIHDKLALIAIEKLKALHRDITFEYRGAGAGGLDIVGRTANGTRKLVAEVKTTHTSDVVGLRGPQKRNRTRLSKACGRTGEPETIASCHF